MESQSGTEIAANAGAQSMNISYTDKGVNEIYHYVKNDETNKTKDLW